MRTNIDIDDKLMQKAVEFVKRGVLSYIKNIANPTPIVRTIVRNSSK